MREEALNERRRIIRLATILVAFSLMISPMIPQCPAAPSPTVENIVSSISSERIRGDLLYLSSLGSRVTGYPGFFEAVQYVVSQFKLAGIRPYGEDGTFFENYSITVPIDHGSSVELVGGESFKAYALWPNYVNPSPYVSPSEGDELIDVGEGLPEDFSGKNVSGKFVLMNFDSRWYFRLAAMAGAKGIIYVGSDITRAVAFQMVYNVPLLFPRLYVDYSDGLKLRAACAAAGGVTRIRVRSSMSWDKLIVPNIVGIVEGTTRSNESIVISAFLDSWSIVPALSPGATDAHGVAVLLELARALQKNPPARSVILLVVSGHWEGLWGAREWVEKHFDSVGENIRCFISLDLSSDNNQLSITNVGSSYGYTNVQTLNTRYSWLVDRFFRTYIPDLRTVLGSSFGANFVDKILLTHPPAIQNSPIFEGVGTVSYDSEPYTEAVYGGGFAFHTTNSLRIWAKTPNDVFSNVNMKNLMEQAYAVIYTSCSLANEPTINLPQNRMRMSPTGEWGYCTLRIQVSEYNITTAFWDPFTPVRHPEEAKNVIVHFTSAGATTFTMLGTSALAGVIDVMAKPDDNGTVVVYGLKPYTTGRIDAYVVNKDTGKIEWATDVGVYRAPGPGLNTVYIATPDYTQMISMFPCGSIVLFSLFNPGDLSSVPAVLIYNHLAHAPMIRQSSLSSFYGDTMVFVMPQTPVELLISTGGRFPIGVLLNASKEFPEGYGYKVNQGETLRLSNTPLKIAEDLFQLTDGRADLAASYNTYNPSIVLFHGLAEENLKEAENRQAIGDLAGTYGYSYSAWAYDQQAYYATMDLIWQVIYTTVFVTMILIPFVILLEKLIYSGIGIRRILFIISSFLVFLAIISLFHPGFHISTNAGMAVTSFGIIVVTIPLMGFIINEALSAAKTIRESIIGIHTTEISRFSAAATAFTTGTENMKKRRFRTMLVLTSLTLIIFGLMTFTSIAAIPIPREDSKTDMTRYPGLLVRKIPWTPIPEEMYFQLDSQYGDEAIVAPRVWIFPPAPPAGGLGRIIFTNKSLTMIGALWGIVPEEANVSRITEALIAGRLLTKEDKFVCLISNVAAQNLTTELERNIWINSKINIWGVELTIVGIFDGSQIWSGASGMLDLDGEPVTPLMPLVTAGEITYTLPPHFTGDQVIIIPYSLAARMMETTYDTYWRFFLSSIAIKPNDDTQIPKIARDMALRMAIDVYYTQSSEDTGNIKIIRARQWFTTVGMESLTIPLIIGGFTVLNLMFASVHERTREIYILASVGLSPLHIASMFLAESTVYAVVSCVLGYIMGVVGCWVFSTLGLYPPGFYPNYSSALVLTVAAVAVSLALVSTAYPASKSSSLALPSLERRWRMPKPGLSDWIIPMPFVATTNSEAAGIMAFVKEYLEGHSVEGLGSFVAQNVSYNLLSEEDRKVKCLQAYIRLAPYDAGIAQNLTFHASPDKSGRFSITLQLIRDRGLRDTWITFNRPFIDGLRKQLLIWRALPQNEKEKYMATGLSLEKSLEGKKG